MYYIEVLHKMGTGNTHLAAAWTTPFEKPTAPAGFVPATVFSAFSNGVPAVPAVK